MSQILLILLLIALLIVFVTVTVFLHKLQQQAKQTHKVLAGMARSLRILAHDPIDFEETKIVSASKSRPIP